MTHSTPDFHDLYLRHGSGIYRYLLRMTGDTAEAEDLTQDTFVSAIQGWGRFRGEASEASWLFRIAHFKARAALRRTAIRRLWRPDKTHRQDPDERLALQESLLRLPVAQREAFLLVKLQGLTLEEAAKSLGVPEGTLKSRVYQAIRSLRSSLSESHVSTPEASHEL